jgi:protein SCO1
MNPGPPVEIAPPSPLPPPGQSQATPRSERRWVWVILATGLALAVAGAGAWKWTRGAGSPLLQGAVLTPPVPAYDFHLPDQDGRMVSLSSLRGKVVALAFLYTHCPDVCPLIADTLHQVHRQLGDLAGGVAFVAVSVDPSGDTPASVRDFLAMHHVQHELTYLRGSLAQLRPVWTHYYVESDAKDVRPGAAGASSAPAQQVGHTAVLYVIDPEGKIDVFLPANFDPKDLLTDIRLLAAQNR